MEFSTGLQHTHGGNDSILVIMDCLTKSVHFLAVKTMYKTIHLAILFIAEIVIWHGIPSIIVFDRDPNFTLRFLAAFQHAMGSKLCLSTSNHPQTDDQALEDMLRACVLESGGN